MCRRIHAALPSEPLEVWSRADNSFCKRLERVNIFVFVGWIVCVVTAQICHGHAEVATGSTEMNRHSCVPVKRHLPKQAAGQIGPTGGHSQNPGLDSALAAEENSLTSTRASCLLLPWAPRCWAGALPEHRVCTQRRTLRDWHVPVTGPAARTQDGSASRDIPARPEPSKPGWTLPLPSQHQMLGRGWSWALGPLSGSLNPLLQVHLCCTGFKGVRIIPSPRGGTGRIWLSPPDP